MAAFDPAGAAAEFLPAAGDRFSLDMESPWDERRRSALYAPAAALERAHDSAEASGVPNAAAAAAQSRNTSTLAAP